MPSEPFVFPATNEGFLAQYPVRMRSRYQGPQVEFPDGSKQVSPAEFRLVHQWELVYRHLRNEERDRFEAFFFQVERSGSPFLFFDPLGNFLLQSLDLTHPAWMKNGAMDITAFTDPDLGEAFVITNNSFDWAMLSQTVGFGYNFFGCFSVETKWDSPVSVQLGMTDSLESHKRELKVHEPRRLFVRKRAGAVASTNVSIEIPPQTQVILARPQLEIALQPTAFHATGARNGIYQQATLAQANYRWISPAPNVHQINLYVEGSRFA
ncbi:MAG: hypothetical protein NW208_07040 [Bryobacter sp.]|nr:hypothetical protein [Bryobacter sp.]